MSKESEHKREYKQYSIMRQSKINTHRVGDASDDGDGVSPKDAQKIKKTKQVKLVKFREGAAHLARAKEKRKIITQMGGNYITDPKLRKIKEQR